MSKKIKELPRVDFMEADFPYIALMYFREIPGETEEDAINRIESEAARFAKGLNLIIVIDVKGGMYILGLRYRLEIYCGKS